MRTHQRRQTSGFFVLLLLEPRKQACLKHRKEAGKGEEEPRPPRRCFIPVLLLRRRHRPSFIPAGRLLSAFINYIKEKTARVSIAILAFGGNGRSGAGFMCNSVLM